MRLALVLGVLLARAAAAASIEAGDRLPALSVQDWDGKPVSLERYAGKPLVIDFWASWCGTCKAALPALDAVARRQREHGVVVIAINIDRNRQAAESWLDANLRDRTVTLLHDAQGTALARFGAEGMPAVYVVDRQGVVRFAEAGYAPERIEAVERAIENVVASKSPG